jgi:menaquinone-dependent protoporphyrinogen IX oxidase
MKGIIVYKSAYGSTAQYADWLKADLGFDCITADQTESIDWKSYQTIIIGCPVIMNKPFLASWIKENWNAIRHARVFLYTTSGAAPHSSALMAGYHASLPEEVRQKLTYLPLPGRFDYGNMRFMHKLMLQIGALIQKDPKTRSRMRSDMRNPIDKVERIALLPLIDAVDHKQTIAGGVS